MARGPSTFRQRDLTAAVKAVLAAGREVARAEIDKTTGNIVLEIDKAQERPDEKKGGNEWDRI
jgi:hypothetical protein